MVINNQSIPKGNELAGLGRKPSLETLLGVGEPQMAIAETKMIF